MAVAGLFPGRRHRLAEFQRYRCQIAAVVNVGNRAIEAQTAGHRAVFDEVIDEAGGFLGGYFIGLALLGNMPYVAGNLYCVFYSVNIARRWL